MILGRALNQAEIESPYTSDLSNAARLLTSRVSHRNMGTQIRNTCTVSNNLFTELNIVFNQIHKTADQMKVTCVIC